MRKMKDSGIEWIGEIPVGWSVCHFRNILDIYNGNSIKDDEKINFEDPIDAVPYIATKDIDATFQTIDYDNGMYVKYTDEAFKRAPTNSILLCIEGGSAGKKIAFTDREVCFINKLCCFTSKSTNNRYIYYYMLSPAFTEEFKSHISGLIGGVSISEIKGFSIVLPNYRDQEKITDFLDKKCTEIDTVIAKTKATIEEYKKLKQSIITEAVTKGLNPNAKMKDSGIEWIGEIPEDWEVKKLKPFLKWKSIKGCGKEVVLSLYRDYGVLPKDSRDDNHNVTSLDTDSYKLVDIGDFVINKMKAWQGSMAVSNFRGIVSPAYHVCSFTSPKIYKPYFHYLMRNKSYLPEYERLSSGLRIGQWDLSFEDFCQLPFLLPPLSEQQQIADYLDQKCSEIDALITKKEQLVVELESYKKSLIYEVVTGKREV